MQAFAPFSSPPLCFFDVSQQGAARAEKIRQRGWVAKGANFLAEGHNLTTSISFLIVCLLARLRARVYLLLCFLACLLTCSPTGAPAALVQAKAPATTFARAPTPYKNYSTHICFFLTIVQQHEYHCPHSMARLRAPLVAPQLAQDTFVFSLALRRNPWCQLGCNDASSA